MDCDGGRPAWAFDAEEGPIETIDYEAWAAALHNLPDPEPADWIVTSVFVERSTAAIAADPAGALRIACAEGFDRHGIGKRRELVSYGWTMIQAWSLRDRVLLAEPMRTSLSGLTDHTTVDLARAFRYTPHNGDGPELFIVLGSALAELPQVLEVGIDHADAELYAYDPDRRYDAVVLLGVLGGAPTEELVRRCAATGGVALPVRTAVEAESFAERCGAAYEQLLKELEAECGAGDVDLREIFGE